MRGIGIGTRLLMYVSRTVSIRFPCCAISSDPEIPKSVFDPVSENPTLVPGSVIAQSVYGSDPEI